MDNNSYRTTGPLFRACFHSPRDPGNARLAQVVASPERKEPDLARAERSSPVHIGAYAWVSSDATVLRGVTIGAHSIIGTRSVVNRDVPAHEFWAGSPARALGTVGDRTHAR